MDELQEEKNVNKADAIDNEYEPMKNSSLDELENAPEDAEELFAEPPLLDFDSEPTDEDLKLEEMDIDNIEDDMNFDMVYMFHSVVFHHDNTNTCFWKFQIGCTLEPIQITYKWNIPC